jgi:hypothetical protein
MSDDEELIQMIRGAATEQLPIAVMTIKEMRQFAQKVATRCAELASEGGVPAIEEHYDLK